MSNKRSQLAAVHWAERALFYDQHGEARDWNDISKTAWRSLRRRQRSEMRALILKERRRR